MSTTRWRITYANNKRIQSFHVSFLQYLTSTCCTGVCKCQLLYPLPSQAMILPRFYTISDYLFENADVQIEVRACRYMYSFIACSRCAHCENAKGRWEIRRRSIKRLTVQSTALRTNAAAPELVAASVNQGRRRLWSALSVSARPAHASSRA